MIPLIKSTFYNELKTKKQLTNFILKSRYLSFGKECEKFEKAFAKYQGRKYCVFVNSGSSANLALIQALLNLGKLKKDDYVGFSALTWSTNAMPIIQHGLKAVPVDIELNTLNVSSSTLKEVLKKMKLNAVFLTNLLGFCDDIDLIKEVCKKEGILLLEDNCEALGTVYKKKKLGNYGYASTFSFYVGHHMSTIEGGAICTDSEELSNMLKLVRAHGWDRNLASVRQKKIRDKFQVNSTFYSRYTFYDLGYNLRPTEINGFIGNKQLKYIKSINKARNENFKKIAEKIYKRKDLYLPIKYGHIDFISNFAVPVICRTQAIRDALVEECDGKVEIRPIVGGDITSQPFFSKYMKTFSKGNPNAHLVHQQGLYFANNPELNSSDVNTLIKIFGEFQIGEK